MPRYSLDELLDVYDNHPLNEAALLARLRATNPELRGLTALDLATDAERQITDQNHVGGLAALLDLADSLQLSPETRVLDIGTGLGGVARIVASRYGCRVDGIDVSPSRCEAHRRLTHLVGLEALVTTICGDFLTMDLPANHYDVAIGLDTFAHFADKRLALRRCHRVLKDGGLLAVHDACHHQPSPGTGDETAGNELEHHWLAVMVTLEEWLELHRSTGFEILIAQDLSPSLIEHFRTLIRVSIDPPVRELSAWRLAVDLGQRGVIRYARTVARKLVAPRF
ncbi:MAG: methyltransferase domain-containing protein [Gemmatimonadetes bacterium]|nr:methyltransferase domain-containing protein [Gemmatimonadota bacterium]